MTFNIKYFIKMMFSTEFDQQMTNRNPNFLKKVW